MKDAERRHRERMALEEKRDRIASMRAEGYSESEIRSAERKRSFLGCLGTLLMIAVGLALFTLLTSRGGDTETEVIEPATYDAPDPEPFLPSDLEEEIEPTIEEPTLEEPEPLPTAEPIEEPIEFVSEPVVQEIGETE